MQTCTKPKNNRLETLQTRWCIRMKADCTRGEKGSHKPKKWGKKDFSALPWDSSAGSGGVEVTGLATYRDLRGTYYKNMG